MTRQLAAKTAARPLGAPMRTDFPLAALRLTALPLAALIQLGAAAAAALILLSWPVAAWGQASASRTPPLIRKASYEVEAVELIITADGQKASALLRHTVRNTGSAPIELDYLAPLPLEGEVAGLALVRDGQELPGNVYGKDEAFGIYQRIVQELRDPALIEYAGRGLYRARVFPLAPGKPATLELRMEWLPPKDEKRVDIVFPLAGPLTAGKTVGRQEATATIRGKGVSGVLSPLPEVEISGSPGLFQASLKIEGKAAIPSFQLHYQEDQGPVGGLILSHKPHPDEDGYLLFLAEPALLEEGEAVPKAVILALDRSGSMDGEKLAQAKGAAKFVLERLGEGDSFSLVDFAGKVGGYSPELEAATGENVQSALKYLANIRAGGGTNISGAIERALSQVPGGKPAYVILLTDGQPTYGETDEAALADRAKAGNPGGAARLFSFGVGHDVNARLLSRLSSQSGGLATFVSPDESIEAKVASLYTKISAPALTGPKVAFSVPVNRAIPAELPDLFMGGQAVLVGRYPKGGPVVATLRGQGASGEMVFAYQATLAGGPSEGGDFLARLWAERRVGELIDELDRPGAPGPASPMGTELIEEIVALAKRHGILTPYTSFLALEEQSLVDGPQILRQAQANLGSLEQLTGESANFQRRWRASVSGAPAAAPKPFQPEGLEGEASPEAIKKMAMSTDQAVAASEGALTPPRTLAGRAFFLKEGQLVEGDLTEAELGGLRTVRKLSDEYFQLAKELGAEGAVLLAQGEPIAFRHDGSAYLIEPAAD